VIAGCCRHSPTESPAGWTTHITDGVRYCLRPPATARNPLATVHNITIHLLDPAGGGVFSSWRLEGAWPCRWSGPALNALGSDVAMEELEIAYDDLVWLEVFTSQ
jgi:phage tail-like protein